MSSALFIITMYFMLILFEIFILFNPIQLPEFWKYFVRTQKSYYTHTAKNNKKIRIKYLWMRATFSAHIFKSCSCDIIHRVCQKYATTQGKFYGKNKQSLYNMALILRPYISKSRWIYSEKVYSNIKRN